MWVVKLGGSLAYSDRLPRWLQTLAESASVVIVPGGGPFADQVRRSQAHWGFGESSAHHMALLAMEQFGTMLCGMHDGLAAATTESEIRTVHARGECPVWMPTRMVMAESTIAHSWDVTSDSLAAWLCAQLGEDALLLVKSIAFRQAGPTWDVERLVEDRIVDAGFERHTQALNVPVRLMSAEDVERFGELLGGGQAGVEMIRRPPEAA